MKRIFGIICILLIASTSWGATAGKGPTVVGYSPNQALETTSSPTFKLVNGAVLASPTGTELVTSWANRSTQTYDTLTTSGSTISSAIKASGNATALSTDSILTVGRAYRVTFTLTSNSGQIPFFRTSTTGTNGSGVRNIGVLAAGVNTVSFVARSTEARVAFATTAATDFSITSFSLQEVPLTSIGDARITGDLYVGGSAAFLVPEVLSTSNVTAGAGDMTGKLFNSYGRAASATVTLPTAASGMFFTAVVGTQSNTAWKFLRGGSDTIIADGISGKTYIQETNQAVGSAMSCQAFQTAAAAWTWLCSTISGTWATD